MGTTLPVWPDNIGKRGKLKVPPDKHELKYTILDEIRVQQTGMAKKLLYLQLIEFDEDKTGKKRMEIRAGYYIIGKAESVKGKWVWGQYAAMMPKEDFKTLVDAAKKKRWI